MSCIINLKLSDTDILYPEFDHNNNSAQKFANSAILSYCLAPLKDASCRLPPQKVLVQPHGHPFKEIV